MPVTGAMWGGTPLHEEEDAAAAVGAGVVASTAAQAATAAAAWASGYASAALVVRVGEGKRWKEVLDSRGWLDRTRRPVSFPPEVASGRPAAVAFPVTPAAANRLRATLGGDASHVGGGGRSTTDVGGENADATVTSDGALALCKLQMPAAATPPDQRSTSRAVVASTAAAAAEAAVSTDGPPLPPAPPMRPDAPLLWPPQPPPPCPQVRHIQCPATREAFAAQVTSLGEPVVLTGVPMGDAPRLWTAPDHFAKCPEANKVIDVHVCPPQREDSGTQGHGDGGDGGSDRNDARNGDTRGGSPDGGTGRDRDRTVVVDLAGHRKPGTRRNFEFRKMPFAELIRRVSSHGNRGGDEEAEGGLAHVVAPGEKYYLRSVAHKTAAHLPASFPSLSEDLRPGVLLPLAVPPRGSSPGGGGSGGRKRADSDSVPGEEEDGTHTRGGGADDTGTDTDTLWPVGAYHSSVLRIASPGTALWTHYDTHDNLLAQVVGHKTVTLWAPGAEPFLYVEGSSSRVDDIGQGVAMTGNGSDTSSGGRFPKFMAVSNRRRVVTLAPGDALYIPALWFHHVLSHPASSGSGAESKPAILEENAGGASSNSGGGGGGGGGNGMSIAVNVFWKCLPAGEHDPGDLFGNKDPPAARRASELAARAGAAIAHLPEPHRTFYARRAVQRLAAQLGMELGGL